MNTPDDKQIDVTGLEKKAARKWTPEEQEEVQRAYDEFEALTLGKKEMSMTELYDLRRYAKKRTDVSKSLEELPPEQFVWKILHDSLDDVIGENMESEKKAHLDTLIDQMDSLDALKEVLEQIVPLGQAIETELVMQQAGLAVYFDKGPENNYKAVVDGVTSDLVNPDKWSPAERIEKAEIVLKIIKANRDYLYQKQLVERHEVIHKKLREFEKVFSAVDAALLEDEEVKKDGVLDLFTRTREWLRLTKDLYASRTKAISAVKNGLDSDEFLPKHVLEKKGDVSGKIKTDETSMFEQMAATVVLINQASEQEEEIAKKRNPLSESIFGKQEEYIKFDKEEVNEITKETVNPNENQSGMGATTKWAIVIALTVVALSWGIWTAIGVFVLGVIILNVMSK